MDKLRFWTVPIALLLGWMFVSGYVVFRLAAASDPPVATLSLPMVEIEPATRPGALADEGGAPAGIQL